MNSKQAIKSMHTVKHGACIQITELRLKGQLVTVGDTEVKAPTLLFISTQK